MIAEHEHECVTGPICLVCLGPRDRFVENAVHLRNFVPELRVLQPVAMSDMIDSEKVPNDDRTLRGQLRRGLGQLGGQAGADEVVAAVDVLDIEAWVWLCLCKPLRGEEGDPRVVADD